MGFSMDRARIHEGIRRMRFEDVLGRSERSELRQIEAAELLGISERSFRRWRDRHRETGLPGDRAREGGLADRRLTPSPRRTPVAEIERMLGLYRDIYRGFTVKHFHEHLVKRHNYVLGYTVTKLHLHREGLVQAAKKRAAHRKKRPRRPMLGMMLHHREAIRRRQARQRRARRLDTRLAVRYGRKYDLVVTMEDATGALYSAFLVDQEWHIWLDIRLVETQHRHGRRAPTDGPVRAAPMASPEGPRSVAGGEPRKSEFCGSSAGATAPCRSILFTKRRSNAFPSWSRRATMPSGWPNIIFRAFPSACRCT
jgi:hypothetical protein